MHRFLLSPRKLLKFLGGHFSQAQRFWPLFGCSFKALPCLEALSHSSNVQTPGVVIKQAFPRRLRYRILMREDPKGHHRYCIWELMQLYIHIHIFIYSISIYTYSNIYTVHICKYLCIYICLDMHVWNRRERGREPGGRASGVFGIRLPDLVVLWGTCG